MKTEHKLLNIISKNGATSIDALVIQMNISRQYVHIIVKKLVEKGQLIKMGTAPHVFYSINNLSIPSAKNIIPYEKERFLNEHFLLVDALGNKLQGLNAMQYWCENQKLTIEKTIDEFIATREKYLSFYNSEHLIEGLKKLENTTGIGELGIDELYYLDFYAIEKFGKTHLGCLMHYAKQGQNKKLMKAITGEIKNRIDNFIIQNQIDALVYVPPTIKRNVQIMDYFEKELELDLPKISVKKIRNEIVIPQKALAKLFERVANAKNTFVVPDQKKYNKVLIIDDAIGSGATINEIALKLKSKKIAKHIIGMAVTGSYKGFEVISEI
ncbi:MAG: winged helix-turn-helix transcriptional regulator [Pelobium sp.]